MLECHLVSGGYDYLLRFLKRGVNHYQEVIEELLERNTGISKYFSYIGSNGVALCRSRARRQNATSSMGDREGRPARGRSRISSNVQFPTLVSTRHELNFRPPSRSGRSR